MKLKYSVAVFVISILLVSICKAGGGCTFSNSCSGATSLSCGQNTNMSNSACTIAAECENCWTGGPCAACSNPPEHHDDCNTTVMGISCFIEGTFCGSPENTQWARFCATATGTYTFGYNSISCTGGGASLQVGLYNQGITCATTDQGAMTFCNGSLTGSTSINANLTAGQCYILVFDGNAGAICTWNFTLTCPILPVVLASFTASQTGDRSITLNWETTSEQNSKEFTITRRYDDLQREDGKSWDEEMNERILTQFPAIPSRAAGNNGTSYALTDDQVLLPGSYNYELFQRDQDGTNHLLGQTEVFVGNPAESAIVNAYYSVASDAFMISYSNHARQPIVMSLYDINGRQVGTQFLGNVEPGFRTARFDTQDLKPGIYLLDLKINGKSERQKLLLR